MDVIIIGIYTNEDKDQLNRITNLIPNLEIVWDYDEYNIEAAEGIKVMNDFYRLVQTGVLVEKDRDNAFSSYPIICDVSDAYINQSSIPKLFQFFDNLKNAKIEKMIIAFANEWEKDTLVKIEKCEFESLKGRLNRLFVWCESYFNIIDNVELRDDFHPLILELK